MNLVPLEADVQSAIIQAFWFKYRIQLDPIDAGGKGFRKASGGNGYSGIPEDFPDLLGSVQPHGVMLSIEVKRPGKKPTKGQREFLERRRREGGVAFWADSVDSACKQFDAAMKERAA